MSNQHAVTTLGTIQWCILPPDRLHIRLSIAASLSKFDEAHQHTSTRLQTTDSRSRLAMSLLLALSTAMRLYTRVHINFVTFCEQDGEP